MRNIEVKILNPQSIMEAERMAVTAARLTQRAEKIESMDDFMNLYNKPYSESFVENLCSMPHPTLQKFEVINIVIVGASRRFLAQITRHQNETKFMSGSLQYSDYSSEDNKTDFVVPYNYLGTDVEKAYAERPSKNGGSFNKVESDEFIISEALKMYSELECDDYDLKIRLLELLKDRHF